MSVYLPSLTFADPRASMSSSRDPSRAPSRAPSVAAKSPRRSMAEDYWTSPSANFGFSSTSTPAASRPASIKASNVKKSSGAEKKSLKSRVKSALGKGTEEYWGGAAQNAKFGVVAPPSRV